MYQFNLDSDEDEHLQEKTQMIVSEQDKTKILEQLNEQYELIKVVYLGHHSFVSIVKEKKTDKEIIHKFSPITVEHECRLLQSLHHPAIIKIQKYVQNSLFFTKYSSSLKDLINKHYFGLQSKFVLSLTKQIAQGIQYLHQNHIIHGDLKPANILLNEGTKNIQCCITDFGNSFQQNSLQNNSPTQTLIYRSPQAIFIRGQAQIDLWGLGLIVYELLTGQELVSSELVETEEELQQFYQEISQQNLLQRARVLLVQTQFDLFFPLLNGLLRINAAQRLSCQQVLDFIEKSI